MDVESKKGEELPTTSAERQRKRRRKRRNICLAVTAVVLGLALLLLILGLTVFKAKRPTPTVHSVSLRDFALSLNLAGGPRVSLNITLDVNLSVKNPNKVGFKYSNSSALLKYRGDVVGEAPIPAGKISAGQTLPLNITLTIMADRFLSNSNLFSDVVSGGKLHLTTFTRISGHVRILFKFHVVSYTTCDLTVDIINRRVSNQTCHYRTRL